MTEKKLYYFAHPYTVKDDKGNNLHAGEEANFNLCCVRSAELFHKGYLVYSPISHSHPIHIRDPKFLATNEWELWMKLDQKIIEACDGGIILAPDWEKSKGCIIEKKIFEKKELEVLLFEDIIKQ